MKNARRSWGGKIAIAALSAALSGAGAPAAAQQRVLGVDISYWNTGNNQSPGSPGISQANWNTAYTTGNREFVFIRATRGGTTGLGQTSGTPGGGSQETLSRRYDDPRFVQNINRATTAGMLAGPYHYGRPDIAGNTGADEADHFIEMAGAWMRPGYLMPVFDLEAGTAGLAQFTIDFSNQIYDIMGIRPGMYINGNHTNHLVNSATPAQLDQIAKPASSTPSVVGPAFPMLWNARYGMGSVSQTHPDYDINAIPIQTGSPQNNGAINTSYYGPWDDYGNSQPWSFWQYASVASIPGINAVDNDVDGNVSHGDIEYVRNYLVPAVWWNDSSGDWSTLANWNSGQTPIAPIQAPGQATPFETGPLPTARLPGAAGSGPTSGQYDTVILERPGANITVTVSTGTHNIRKLYMRETLNITGGSLTINYDPTYRPDNSSTVLHGGPISAQFSGAVTLSGGSLSVHTLQVDSTRTFTLGGGSLAFHTIHLMPASRSPARLLMTGDVDFASLAGAIATIANGAGAGSSGFVDLTGGNRTFDVANGSADVDLSIDVPIINGALTKSGGGTLALNGANTYSGDTTVLEGKLTVGNAFLSNAADVYLSLGTTLDLNFAGTDLIDSLFIDGISQAVGIWGAEGSEAAFTSPLITGSGLLQVTTYVPQLPGDYNEDGIVDAADYVVWRNNLGSGVSLPNDDTPGVGQDDYERWKVNFGQTLDSGSNLPAANTIPEPSSMLLMAIVGVVLRFATWRRR